MKFNSSCFSPFKWKYHHISTLELRTFHKEYVGFIRSFQFSSVSLNNINKTCGHGQILKLKKSLRNSKCTGKTSIYRYPVLVLFIIM